MKTLVRFGAPESILVDGKPHLGTDRLVPLLRCFRQHLLGLGVSQIIILPIEKEILFCSFLLLSSNTFKVYFIVA